ncbi:FtsK/SpoIIIE domain-containing protein [Agromyces cerinus]|uniref:DNA segregation ATPase FtsK/SpoIIIE, S-DNA-T family n=1 Tax=Agromyces cerinus subsp. cerinus TaxID=232089 RepID=A0A1N6H8X0_9MICO|nr:FtsK/SpoIIIE domain-containing protein [Agromyces cerinus]SIO16212.1 DNA segregation ATPase FtsK/SpoIIIE, S-DNA-T family [Agromyces cerinus subsp. cerinus]
MKLKLTVRQSDAPERDLLVTMDALATIGDLARFLRASDPNRVSDGHRADAPADEPTLRVTAPGASTSQLVNPLATVHESPLRSGCTVDVAEQFDPDATGLPPLVDVEVVSGPDRGRRFSLAAGVNYVGRSAAAQVRLTDEGISRSHATITVGDSVVIADLNSANGVEVDGRHVDRAQLGTRSLVRLGGTELQLRPAGHRRVLGVTSAVEASARVDFVRSPRVEPVYAGHELTAPELPTAAEKPRFPMLAVLAPVVLGAVLFVVTQNPITLLFIALSPIIMLGTWIDGVVQARRRRRDEAARFESGLEALGQELEEETRIERRARLAESPSGVAIAGDIRERGPLLWTRKAEHVTFLDVRFGTGALPSRSTVTPPTRTHAAADEWNRVMQVIDRHRTIEGVPVVENLDRAGAIGVAGDSPFALGAARALILQLAALHSPADVVLTAIGGPASAQEWAWLKWLPHVDSPHSPLRGALADEFASAASLLAELEELVGRRRAAGSGRGERVRSRLTDAAATSRADDAVDREPATPAVVVLVLGDAPADTGRLVALGEDGADYGVHLIWLARDARALPVVCRTFLDVDDTGRTTVGFVRQGRSVELAATEAFSAREAGEFARLLAPLEDVGAPVLDESDLPRSVAFLDLFDEAVADDADAVLVRWAKNDSLRAAWTPGERREPGGIRALVGQGPTDPFYLDLRRHGPHALVGGTTGSGKSEFLQTWILGIATEYSPDRVTFLLVDYKGGAAFAECVDLPHTVGLVTDLNAHLVRRALTSLRAELKHREQLLNAKGAKDLETLESRSDPDAPPALVIVIDEFAALAAEVPEFVDGVIDVAQRGRSLGLHLVMATQRPAGVIKDSLRANTNLRVALRVADEADSLDVLGTDRAAHFDPATPGRAASKLGPGRVHDFQTAFLGGWTNADASTASDIEAAELVFGRGQRLTPGSRAHTDGPRVDEPRDIERLVRTIGRTATASRLAVPRRPWLDQLLPVIDLASIPVVRDGTVAVGLLDEPETQRQVPLALDFDRTGNLAVFGASGSGKSAALRTVAIAASMGAAQHPVRVYGLDFAGGALASLESLPTVGSIIDGGDVERVARLIRHLTELVDVRAAKFARHRAASLAEYRARSADLTEPRVIVLLDGMSAFRAEHEFGQGGRLFDAFTRILTAGRQLGVHVVVSADRIAAFPSALLAAVQQRLTLRLASPADYSMAGVPDDVLDDAPPGRGLLGGHEVQLGVVGGSTELGSQAAATELLAARLRQGGVRSVAEIERLPERIDRSHLPATVDGRPAVGISDETLGPVGIPLDGLFVVTGPFGSGRTTAMRTMLQAVRETRPELTPYLVVARRSALIDATDWAEASADADEAESLATRLAAALELPHAERDRDRLIVIENVGDFEGLGAEVAVARLLKAARRAEVAVLVEADTVTAVAAWQIHSELKTARAGIVLQPEETDGIALFRVQFPRVTRADFPVGRGILVEAGRVMRVQLAMPDADTTTEPSTRRGRRTSSTAS